MFTENRGARRARPRETTDLLVDANYERLNMRLDSNDPF